MRTVVKTDASTAAVVLGSFYHLVAVLDVAVLDVIVLDPHPPRQRRA